MKQVPNEPRPACSRSGCACRADAYHTKDGLQFFSECQKHRKQHRRERVIERHRLKPSEQHNSDGKMLCMVEECHRLSHRTTKLCDYHRRSYDQQHQRRAAKVKGTRLRRYGLSAEGYDLLLRAQDGLCAVCGIKPSDSLHIDHCHATGRIRGLLCQCCNTGIGQFKDNANLLIKAAEYLK